MGGYTTRFWELFSRIDLVEIFLFMNHVNTKMVDNFWDTKIDQYWWKSKQKGHWENALETQEWGNLERELQSRKIPIVTGDDILRWGYRTKCMFKLNKVKILKLTIFSFQIQNYGRKFGLISIGQKLNTSYGFSVMVEYLIGINCRYEGSWDPLFVLCVEKTPKLWNTS